MVGRYLATGSLLAALAVGCTAAGSDSVEATTSTMQSPVTTLATLTTTTTLPPQATTTAQVSTTTSVPPEPQRTRLVVNGTGDINLDPLFVRTFPSTGYEDAWTGLFDVLLDDDLTVVNLECSPSELGEPWVKTWNFRCDTEALPSMAAAGVDVANLANNHSMDFGMEAMLDGMNNLRVVGIQPVGTGRNRAEAYAPALFTVNGWRVAIIGSGGVNPETGSWIASDDSPGMTSGDDTESIAEAIRLAKQTADIVLVTAHWGKNDETSVMSFERRQAEAWIEAGADGIFAHHQHRLLPLEWIDGKPVAFGLGNFVWQAYPAEAKRTAIAQFVFEPDGRIGACLIPVVIERTGHPVVQEPGAPVCAPN
jgi:poly-gamma-glutamate synthesis protein (capsule biosynthesis protein)